MSTLGNLLFNMKESVLLGFSGGIDSRSAAQQLSRDGYRVVLLTIDTIADTKMVDAARKAATELGLEWLCYDAREDFKRDIIDYFCAEYRSGRTPAPCTRCNTHIKWRILEEVADKMGIDHIATGHYFGITVIDNKYYITKGTDRQKDQSYYLWGLQQSTLRRALTPMSKVIKSVVKSNFEDKSESMGICFLRGSHYADFVEEQGAKFEHGDIVDNCGNIIARHNGIVRYTIGQRRGVGIPEGLRVVDINAASNSIVVDKNERLDKQKLYIEHCTIVDEAELLQSDDITIKIRGIGRNPQLPVKVERTERGFCITTTDSAWAPAKGQPLVLYRGNLVIGGGIIVDFK